MAPGTSRSFARRRRLVLGAGALGLASVGTEWTPFLPTSSAPGIRIALATASAVVALFAWYLVGGKLPPASQRFDSAVAFALGLLAGASALVVIPAHDMVTGAVMHGWAPLLVRLAAAAALAVAAVGRAPPRPRRDGSLPRSAMYIGATLAGVLAFLAIFPEWLRAPLVQVTDDPSMFEAHPVLRGGQLATMILFGVAAAGAYRRERREPRELHAWIACMAALLAFAHFHQFAFFPIPHPDYVHAGDLMRLVAHLMLLIGCLREMDDHWRRLAADAVAGERRRVARELHDGLTQELNFIAGQTRELVNRTGADELVRPLNAAVDRALDESRRAVTVLADRMQSLEDGVTQTAESVASRSGARVNVDVDESRHLPEHIRQELLRIIREAVNNAVRHGEASTIAVRLHALPNRIELCIEDDGSGFEQGRADPHSTSRFGLTSMRERAESLGGDFHIHSRLGAGSIVEVTVPWSDPSESSSLTTTPPPDGRSAQRSSAMDSPSAPKWRVATRRWLQR